MASVPQSGNGKSSYESSDENDGSTDSDSESDDDTKDNADENNESLEELFAPCQNSADAQGIGYGELNSSEEDDKDEQEKEEEQPDDNVPPSRQYHEQGTDSIIDNRANESLSIKNDGQQGENCNANLTSAETKDLHTKFSSFPEDIKAVSDLFPVPNSTFLVKTNQYCQFIYDSIRLLPSSPQIDDISQRHSDKVSEGQLHPNRSILPSITVPLRDSENRPILPQQNEIPVSASSFTSTNDDIPEEPQISIAGSKTSNGRNESIPCNAVKTSQVILPSSSIENSQEISGECGSTIPRGSKNKLTLNFIAKLYHNGEQPDHGLNVTKILVSLCKHIPKFEVKRWKDMFEANTRKIIQDIHFSDLNKLYWGDNYTTNKEFMPWYNFFVEDKRKGKRKRDPNTLTVPKVYGRTSEIIGRYCNNKCHQPITAALFVKVAEVLKKPEPTRKIKKHLGSELFIQAKSIITGEDKDIWAQTISLPRQLKQLFPGAHIEDEEAPTDDHSEENYSGSEEDERAEPQVTVLDSHSHDDQNASIKIIKERLKSLEKRSLEKASQIKTIEETMPVLKSEVEEEQREIKELKMQLSLLQKGDKHTNFLPGDLGMEDNAVAITLFQAKTQKAQFSHPISQKILDTMQGVVGTQPAPAIASSSQAFHNSAGSEGHSKKGIMTRGNSTATKSEIPQANKSSKRKYLEDKTGGDKIPPAKLSRSLDATMVD